MVREMSVFDFKDEDALGKVAYVDTSSVIVDVENIEHLRGLKVIILPFCEAVGPGSILLVLLRK